MHDRGASRKEQETARTAREWSSCNIRIIMSTQYTALVTPVAAGGVDPAELQPPHPGDIWHYRQKPNLVAEVSSGLAARGLGAT
jgi:hypothetical protein